MKIAFGPVPSRRLGNSLGINNIPAKTCSYGCVYCQVGRTGNIEEDLLSITAVHPLREDAVEALLKRNHADWTIVRKLIASQQLIDTEYHGHIFYMRKFS